MRFSDLNLIRDVIIPIITSCIGALGGVVAAIITARAQVNKQLIAALALFGVILGCSLGLAFKDTISYYLINKVSSKLQLINIHASSVYSYPPDPTCYEQTNISDDKYIGDSDTLSHEACGEWASQGEKEGAQIEFDLTEKACIEKIILYDRINSKDHILSGKIYFSKPASATKEFERLDNSGAGTPIELDDVVAQHITITIDKVSYNTVNIGFTEIEVYGTECP